MGQAREDQDRRRTLMNASAHILRGEVTSGPDGDGEYLRCTCGWISPQLVCWHDDVVLTDLRRWVHVAPHDVPGYVLVYSPGHDMAIGGIVLGHQGGDKALPRRDLVWLTAQPDVPELLRSAAAAELAAREHR